MPPSVLRNIGLLLFFAASFYFVYSLFPKKKEQEVKKKLEDEKVVLGEGAQFVNLFRPFFQLIMPFIEKLPVAEYRNRVENML